MSVIAPTAPPTAPGPGSPGGFDPVGGAAARRQRARRRRRTSKAVTWAARLLVIALFMLVWQWYADRQPPLIMPSPGEVWKAFVDFRSLIWTETLFTLSEVLWGFFFGATFGIGAGVLIAHSKRLEAVLGPFIVASQAIPKTALAPMFIIWFGFGTAPKIIIAALLTFFPLLENTVTGVRRIDRLQLRLFRSLGAGTWSIFWKLRFVNALPYVLTACRVSLVYALVGALVGEFISGNRGLGAQITQAQGNFNTTLMFALLVAATVMGLVLYGTVRVVESLLMRRLNLGEGLVSNETSS
jgi:NitT/TauT family transport system permease protein